MLGHDRGDTLLVEIADRLVATAGDDAAVGRLGADVFAVVLDDATDQRIHDVASALVRAVNRPVRLGEVDVRHLGDGRRPPRPTTPTRPRGSSGPRASRSRTPSARPAIGSGPTPASSPSTPPSGCASSRSCAPPRPRASSRSTSSRWSRSTTARSSVPRRCCDGTTRPEASSTPPSGSTWRRRSGSSPPSVSPRSPTAAGTSPPSTRRGPTHPLSVAVNLSPAELLAPGLVDHVRGTAHRHPVRADPTGARGQRGLHRGPGHRIGDRRASPARRPHRDRRLRHRVRRHSTPCGRLGVDQVKIDRTFVEDLGNRAHRHRHRPHRDRPRRGARPRGRRRGRHLRGAGRAAPPDGRRSRPGIPLRPSPPLHPVHGCRGANRRHAGRLSRGGGRRPRPRGSLERPPRPAPPTKRRTPSASWGDARVRWPYEISAAIASASDIPHCSRADMRSLRRQSWGNAATRSASSTAASSAAPGSHDTVDQPEVDRLVAGRRRGP